MVYNGLLGPEAGGIVKADTIQTPDVLTSLNYRKESLERQLKDVNGAIAALNEQPKLIDIFNLLRRVGM